MQLHSFDMLVRLYSKSFKLGFSKYVNWELPDVQSGFRKGRGTRDQIANICWIIEKAREKAMAPHSSTLDWRIPGTGEPGGLQSVGSHRVRHDWNDLAVASAEKARKCQKNIYFCFIDYTYTFDCVDHNKLWKTPKEMGIPDHFTCLLRNLYAGREATVRTSMKEWTGSKLGKEYSRLCIVTLLV